MSRVVFDPSEWPWVPIPHESDERPRYIPVLFVDATRQDQSDLTGAFAAALVAVSQAGEEEALLVEAEEPIDVIGYDLPELTPDGPAWMIFCEIDAGPHRLLARIATALESQGWSGRLVPYDSASIPKAPLQGQSASSVLVLAWSGARPKHPPRLSVSPAWRSGSGQGSRSTALAVTLARWLREHRGTVYFRGGWITQELRGQQVDLVLGHWLTNQNGSTTGTAASIAGERRRQVEFTRTGHVLVHDHDPHHDADARLARLMRLGRELGTACDYAFIVATPHIGYRGLRSVYEAGGHGTLTTRDYYEYRRDLDQQYVPDSFLWQVLTGTHLARASSLDGWSITPLGADRFEVSLPLAEIAAALSTTDAESTGIVGGLEQARQDFGAMVLTPDKIDESTG